MSQSFPRSSRSAENPSNHDYELTSIPESWQNLSEIEAPPPSQNPDESPTAEYRSLEDEVYSHRGSSHESNTRRQQSNGNLRDWHQHDTTRSNNNARPTGDIASAEESYYTSPKVANLSEAIPDAVIDNPEEAHRYSHRNLEEEIGQSQISEPRSSHRISREGQRLSHEQSIPQPPNDPNKAGRVATNLYIYSYLVFFSIFGTLARLGLAALTTYSADVIRYSSIWPNFAGTFILGFLSEGAELLHHPAASRSIARMNSQTPKELTPQPDDTGRLSESSEAVEPAESNVPIPLHIGLSTGFCGSFTTFSTFMRDCFAALSGMLVSTSLSPSSGQDFMSVAAVVIITISLCVAALKAGAHTAILFKSLDRRLPRRFVHWVDRVVLILGIGCWFGAIIMCIIPPDRFEAQETWRGHALFAIVFAPMGCILRFFMSIKLNLRVIGFPLGTFCANMLGTLILAMVWDLQRIPDRNIAAHIGGSMVSCQVLQGIEDGFCGCLTTVSTWILELSSLRRKHAYRYGIASLSTALAIVITVMGSLKWTVGLQQPVCTQL